MIYHLSLHEKHANVSTETSSEGEEIIPRVIIPHQAPVNPVPHLEGKEKMFDKMTNLAFSSHSDNPSGYLFRLFIALFHCYYVFCSF